MGRLFKIFLLEYCHFTCIINNILIESCMIQSFFIKWFQNDKLIFSCELRMYIWSCQEMLVITGFLKYQYLLDIFEVIYAGTNDSHFLDHYCVKNRRYCLPNRIVSILEVFFVLYLHNYLLNGEMNDRATAKCIAS